MGFFDPPHEKIIGWAPSHFHEPARMIVPILDTTIAELGAPASGQKLFRTAIIGRLALMAAEEDPESWSATGLQLVQTYTQNAERAIPSGFRHLVPVTTEILLTAFTRTVATAQRDSPTGSFLG